MAENTHNMFYGAPAIIHKLAKDLRQRETKAEKILWSFLSNKKLQVKFRRQHPISQFIVDFYCHELELVVEADGEIHNQKEQREYDKKRDASLKNFGLQILRFKNSEILLDSSKVINRIQLTIDDLNRRKTNYRSLDT